jgi:transcriptional antiterminator Rof (Rho-off)
MSDKTLYQPISCEIHSELELAVMRRQPVIIKVVSVDNQAPQTYEAIIEDILIQNHAEYAKVLIDGKNSLIRLDHISGISPKITK